MKVEHLGEPSKLHGGAPIAKVMTISALLNGPALSFSEVNNGGVKIAKRPASRAIDALMLDDFRKCQTSAPWR